MLQKIDNAQVGAYTERFNGKSLPKFLNDIIDAINNLLQNGGGSGPDTRLQSLSLNGTTLTATMSNSSTIPVSLGSLASNAYEVTDIAARDAIASPSAGSVAFINNADGNGNPGICGYTGSAWTSPLIITPGGGSGSSDSRYSAGNGVIVTADGANITTTKSGGLLTITVPAQVTLKSFRFAGGAADLNSGELRIVVVGGKGSGTAFNTASADLYHPDITIQNRTTIIPGDPFLQRPDDASDSINIFDEDFSSAGEVSVKITGLSGDFGIKATF